MNQNETEAASNPLETAPIDKLIFKYSIPAMISSLVGSIYNIVDQIFIGNKIVCSSHSLGIVCSAPINNGCFISYKEILGILNECR